MSGKNEILPAYTGKPQDQQSIKSITDMYNSAYAEIQQKASEQMATNQNQNSNSSAQK